MSLDRITLDGYCWESPQLIVYQRQQFAPGAPTADAVRWRLPDNVSGTIEVYNLFPQEERGLAYNFADSHNHPMASASGNGLVGDIPLSSEEPAIQMTSAYDPMLSSPRWQELQLIYPKLLETDTKHAFSINGGWGESAPQFFQPRFTFVSWSGHFDGVVGGGHYDLGVMSLLLRLVHESMGTKQPMILTQETGISGESLLGLAEGANAGMRLVRVVINDPIPKGSGGQALKAGDFPYLGEIAFGYTL